MHMGKMKNIPEHSRNRTYEMLLGQRLWVQLPPWSGQGRSQNFQRGGGSPADTNNYDRFDTPIALNTREV